LNGILRELIIPSVKRKELAFREKGLVVLGLCCLIAKVCLLFPYLSTVMLIALRDGAASCAELHPSVLYANIQLAGGVEDKHTPGDLRHAHGT
jgi:hypothetical protein